MAECWEALAMNRNIQDLDEQAFTSYQTELLKISASAGAGAVISRPLKREAFPAVTPPAKKASISALQNMETSDSGKRRISLSPLPPLRNGDAVNKSLPKYGDRKDAGKVMVTFNPNKLPVVGMSDSSVRSKFATIAYDFETNVQASYRHMFTTLEERAKALDEHLLELSQVMATKYGLEEDVEMEGDSAIAPLEAVGIPRQVKVTNIGRICNDVSLLLNVSETFNVSGFALSLIYRNTRSMLTLLYFFCISFQAHDGRINPTSVLLEGSRHVSGGARVEVDLSFLQSNKTPFALFPGQIVAVEGMNASGRKLVASRICEGVAHEPATSTLKELLHFHHDVQDGTPLKIMSACGPYTTADNLEFEPLIDFLHVVVQEKPDVVILAGPFVDMQHKAVLSGQTTLQFQDGDEIHVPYEMFFANKVAAFLDDLYTANETLHTQFVLQPSMDDATAEWVYPQPPFADSLPGGKNLALPGAEGIESGTLGLQYVENAGREGKGPKRIHCVSNPCTLKINEVIVGITSTDILFHLSADETSANLEMGSRLARLSQHMLQQRSYYPLFPAAPNTNLNLKQMKYWSMPCQPDLLIIPSRLTSFARTVLGSTLVVNPGRLSQNTVGGSFALVDVHPMNRETLEIAGGEDVEVQHGVNERSRVEIRKI
jgi:DNA polymerase alpha subunit B